MNGGEDSPECPDLIGGTMLLLKIIGVVAVLFAAGLTTSYAEYKFQYSLFMTVASQLFGKKF